jgi:hypothetical protein
MHSSKCFARKLARSVGAFVLLSVAWMLVACIVQVPAAAQAPAVGASRNRPALSRPRAVWPENGAVRGLKSSVLWVWQLP